ncbi:MAG: UDP-N-acetylmuramoyl-tripeptide--D-alanyl-D-alanine ligase, partial [Verrucomicrobia bacterium]|nr:UDP-N-acetylmuramoyl-tripeptide--D-alanyl-D-alanine ligase [Verrucomicrobiota bacterium]
TSRTRGNWNNHIGVPLSMLAMPSDTQTGVFEVGSNHPGEIADLSQLIRPTSGILTNVGAAHVGNFASLEAVAREKSALLAALPDSGMAFLNQDDAFFDLFAAATAAQRVTISATGAADYYLVERDVASRQVVVEERATSDRLRFTVPNPGLFSIYNALFAVAVGRLHRVDWAPIQQVVEAGVALPMRWQRSQMGGILVINDAYNASPGSMRAAVNAFAEEPVQGQRWLVLGGMLELGSQAQDEHVTLGHELAKGDWAGIVVVGELGHWIATGAEAKGVRPDGIYRCADTAAAAAVLAGALSPGDGVLLKGSRGLRIEDVAHRLNATCSSR